MFFEKSFTYFNKIRLPAGIQRLRSSGLFVYYQLMWKQIANYVSEKIIPPFGVKNLINILSLYQPFRLLNYSEAVKSFFN